MTVTDVVAVTVDGTGQLAPGRPLVPGRIEGRTEEGIGPVGMDMPVPVPVGP